MTLSSPMSPAMLEDEIDRVVKAIRKSIGVTVLIGPRCMVLKAVSIGEGSVVAGSIPPRTLAGGTPARLLRSLSYAKNSRPHPR